MHQLSIADLLELAELAKVEDYRSNYLKDLPWGRVGLYYNFMYLLAQKMNPHTIVELGVNHGVGTAHLALGAPGARIFGIDIDLSVFQAVTERNMFLWQGSSLEFADSIRASNEKNRFRIDLLMIDTEHTTIQCLAEYHTYLPLMSKGGIVLFDDIFMGGMAGVWPAIAEPKVILPDLHANLGFGAAII